MARKTEETAPKTSRKTKADVVDEEDVVDETPKKTTRKPKTVAEETPKKTTRKSKVVEDSEEEKPKKTTRKPKTEDSEEEKPKTKRTRKPKVAEDESEEEVEKPKRTRKPKAADNDETEKTKRTRKVVTLEDVENKFAALVESLDAEMKSCKEGKNNGSLKYLRSVKSQVKDLGADCNRLAKAKQQRKRREGSSQSGGFNKPLRISAELAKFLGCKSSDLVSRNDVTRFVCKYIKDNELQDPSDGRIILGNDTLNTLLDYHPGKEDPLRYPTIQKKINRHYLGPAPVESD